MPVPKPPRPSPAPPPDPARLAALREQHQRRLAWMPWLYFALKPRHQGWAQAWQAEVQALLRAQIIADLDQRRRRVRIAAPLSTSSTCTASCASPSKG